ncbi:TonB family protein [Phenylobacterium sp.]|uniref:TonB family protein n=1 Tax=Phenylobacterium sp. TaxID=1871053 RepID=UPI00301BE756
MIAVLASAVLQVGASPADAGSAGAVQPTSESAREIPDPVWGPLVKPGNPLRFYPKAAMKRGVEGRAILRCIVEATGALRDCVVAQETPPGEGFGEAAIRMSVMFRVKPLTASGAPSEGGIVTLPIRFDLPK